MSNFKNNIIIYHIIIDRFARVRDEGISQAHESHELSKVGEFWGGDISEIIQKMKDGWFSVLGINTILISPFFEQIHGWVPGAGGQFKHYAYHGYYVLDYTIMDSRYGSSSELHDLVSCAHASGIQVWMDVVLNHPGYPEPQTWRNLGLEGWHSGWEEATPCDFHRYMNRESLSLSDWWGPDWVRYGLPGYPSGGQDDYTMLLHDLPDFKTESTDYVRLPHFLKGKANTKAVDLPDTTVRGYLIKWLTDWVRQYGIDGFRCDSAKHVEPEAWLELKQAATQAKYDWWERQHDKTVASPDFWMLGEVFGHGIERSHYFDYGFNSVINFKFKEDYESGMSLDILYESYAARLLEHPDMDFVSYISSHDTHLFDRQKLKEGGTALMLAPGGVLLLYGDETSRLPGPIIEEDPAQATRSPMNWNSIDAENLALWRKLIRFRARHGAIARGIHLKLHDSPYVFARVDASGDRIVAALLADGELALPVGEIFGEGEKVRDAYGGWRGVVKDNMVRLPAKGVVLLEADDGVFPDWDAASEEGIHP